MERVPLPNPLGLGFKVKEATQKVLARTVANELKKVGTIPQVDPNFTRAVSAYFAHLPFLCGKNPLLFLINHAIRFLI